MPTTTRRRVAVTLGAVAAILGPLTAWGLIDLAARRHWPFERRAA